MLPDRETLTVEFKSDRKGSSDTAVLGAVVAFANTEGGHIYLGIEDSGEVTGVGRKHSDPIGLCAYIANNTVPPVAVRAEIIDDINPVLVISVPKMQSGVAATSEGKVLHRRLKADGTPENVPMYPAEYATRLSDLRLLDYSAMPLLQCGLSDIDPLQTEYIRHVIQANNGDKLLLELADADLLKAMGLTRVYEGRAVPTAAGLLLAGKQAAIKAFMPTYSVTFQVLQGSEVRVNEDFVLPVLAAVEKLLAYISAWNPEHEFQRGAFRAAVAEFDNRAVREAIVNAFSHRDYTKMGRIRVCVNDDGLTVSNPGGFIEGVSVKNLLNAEPYGRNPLLADVLKRVGLAERTGRGIDRIYEGSLLFGRALPDYSLSTQANVSVILPRSLPDVQLSALIAGEQERQRRPLSLNMLLVLNALKDYPRSSVAEICEHTNLNEPIARNILEKCLEMGLAQISGRLRKNYLLASSVYEYGQNRFAGASPVNGTSSANGDASMGEAQVLDMAKEKAFITRADVISLLNVSDNKAYKLLRRLVNNGDLEAVNKGRYAKYRLTANVIPHF